MKLEPDPDRGSKRTAAYVSPNAPFVVAWEPRHAPIVEVMAPRDLVRREASATAPSAAVAGVDALEHRRVRERVSYLEGALAAAERVEAAAQTFADRLEERATAERVQYERDLGELRVQLDFKERELRTLALEMGKLQGRLEITQQKLLAPREPGAPMHSSVHSSAQPQSAAAAQDTPPRLWDTNRGAFFGGLATAVVLLIVSAILR